MSNEKTQRPIVVKIVDCYKPDLNNIGAEGDIDAVVIESSHEPKVNNVTQSLISNNKLVEPTKHTDTVKTKIEPKIWVMTLIVGILVAIVGLLIEHFIFT